MTEAEQIAAKVGKEIDRICKKYKCEIGVWLTWRDLLYNFDQVKKTPGVDELKFGLEIRLNVEESENTAHPHNEG